MKITHFEKALCLATLLFILVFGLFFTDVATPNIRGDSPRVVHPYHVDINTASVEDFAEINGIGKKIARRIVDYREQHGDFENIDELCKVSGIGRIKLDKIKDYIMV